MAIVWYTQAMGVTVRVRPASLELSEAAYSYFEDKAVVIGLDADTKMIYMKPSTEKGLRISSKPHRISNKDLLAWFTENGVEQRKYSAKWDEENGYMTIKY